MNAIAGLDAFLQFVEQPARLREELQALGGQVIQNQQDLERSEQTLARIRGVIAQLEARDPLEAARVQLAPLENRAASLAQEATAVERATQQIQERVADFRQRAESLQAALTALQEVEVPSEADRFFAQLGGQMKARHRPNSVYTGMKQRGMR